MPTNLPTAARPRRSIGAVLLEIRCARCGYGGIVSRLPQRCPMCGGATWHAETARGRRGEMEER